MKWIIYLGATVGGLLGGYVPVWLWHVDALSGSSILWGTIGTIVGIWIGYRFARAQGL